jgi:exodeoxyribonuclease VII small subunit
MTKKAEVPDYQTLKNELDAVMAELQSEDLDIDRALTLYKRGLELVTQLKKHLKAAENIITELKAKFADVS